MKSKQYNYDTIKYGFYDEIFRKKKGIRSAWHHIKFNFIKKKINKYNSHLDIGCGSGTFISLLDNKFVAGIDISDKQIKYAKKIYGSKQKKFYSYKKTIPFKPKTFDSVSLVELIEHLNDNQIDNLMKQIHIVLKKEGKIYITTPNYFSLWPILEYFVNRISSISYEDQHINKFNLFRLNKIVDNKKFKVKKKCSFMLVSPFLAIFSFKFSLVFANIENILTKIFPGFLLYFELEKK